MSISISNPFLAHSLETVARSLDIPPSKYKEAVERYTAVGRWLDAVGTTLKSHAPAVSVQGSFRLGTVVRPVVEGKEADYDIDLVCRLDAPGASMTPRLLKHLVRDRLRENSNYSRMLGKEGRRCWTLNYAEADGIGFHMDVLPCTPRTETLNPELTGVPRAFASHAIELSECRGAEHYVWLPGGSNPAGYALWFESRNQAAMLRVAPFQRKLLYESNSGLFASVDSVPDALIRSPLQRAVQILKRHRDVRFAGHALESQKPISVIITTLAATAYRGELDVATALDGILDRVEDFATSGVIQQHSDQWVIPNPVNPSENFADRWNELGSSRAEAFFKWVSWVREDLTRAEEQSTESSTLTQVAESLGVSDFKAPRMAKSGTMLKMQSDSVPPIASTSHCQPPPWPFGRAHGVKVSGHIWTAIRVGKRLWPLSERPVQKGLAICFEAATNVSLPFEIKWQVVNTGSEAASAGPGQLRGGFDSGEGLGGTVKWETTKFRGTHWVEAFVVKGGECLARSGRVQVKVT